MAREFAKKLYNSKAWKQCRDTYKQSVNGLCERCLKRGQYVLGDEAITDTLLDMANYCIMINWVCC